MLRDESIDGEDQADEALDRFLPAVAGWFRENLGEPTKPQRLGWPEIAAGRHTLIVAPTGSGKTLAAFLAALDLLWRTPRREKGVRILYISPLKALNEDVRRNLQRPLEGILEHAEGLGSPLTALSVATRSGDTPQAERARIVRKPPDILITTPESLHLMLTSRAREVLRGVSHVILDEIHAVCGDKRGVFLSLLLERLEAICSRSFVRIGLSATQRPLEEVARYLGGRRIVADAAGGDRRFEPRPVTIIDAGRRKTMDLKVLWPGADGGGPPGPPQTVWPAIADRLIALTEEHRSTIVFANNRRTVEKLTARLNEALEPGVVLEVEDGEASPGVFRPHHGSLSLEERRATEEELKSGKLRAVIATASLELGIDMGDVDLVCQVESPGSVARGLQRVGRAGHVVHGVSKGRLIAKTPSDLLETAALVRSMIAGEIETSRVPGACLDVLAQQVVACVAMDRWTVPELFDLVRRAYPFRDLPAEALEQVLLMVSGRFPTGSLRELRARVVWDRIHNALAPLPGTAKLAIVGGGTIPDTGQFPVYLGEGGPRLGELDEEFVFERRVGETFALGNSLWRILVIDAHRVIVQPAEGQNAVMPFWRGESAPRTVELGEAVGALTREVAGRVDDPSLPSWLEAECRLDARAARQLIRYIARQQRVAGAVPDDRTVLYETFRDQTGELGLAVLSPFGGRVHQALKIALLARIRERYRVQASCLHGDDGLLIRLPQMDEPPLDLLDGLDPDEAERLIRRELPDTALFGLRFRQNAARALLMPRPDPAKRTPLWLQRLRAKDLLQVVGQFPEFPIVVETYRECLEHDLELPRLRALLSGIGEGSIRVVTRPGEIASPFASDLIFEFTPLYMYQWDEPRRGDQRAAGAAVDEDLLDALLDAPAGATLVDPQAVGRVEGRLRRKGLAPRTAEEMAETLASLGDLAPSEVVGPMERWLLDLEGQGRASRIELTGTSEPSRWIPAEEAALYRAAFERDEPDRDALDSIVRRFVRTHALVGLAELTSRYPIPPEVASDLLDRWVESGSLVRLSAASEGAEPRWAEGQNLAEIRRLTLAMRRRESVAVSPEVFADFLARRQGLDRPAAVDVAEELDAVLDRLRGFAASPGFWEEEILPRRVRGYRPGVLDDLLARGEWSWRAAASGPDSLCVAFTPRDFAGRWPAAGPEVGEDGGRVLEALGLAGASFALDLARRTGLDPSAVRKALDELLRLGLVTNDRFDPLRSGGGAMTQALEAARAVGAGRRGSRRLRVASPEGRWSRLAEPGVDPDDGRLAWIDALLDRYGVLTRELVELDRWAPPWAELYPLLARGELRGELRRGYFVEGFSGVQYATEEAADELASLAGGGPPGRDVLVAAADPANLYGSGAPLDIALLEGGTARLSRLPGNYLVLRGGRPVLIIEGHGKRLTGLASASKAEIDEALTHVATLARTRSVLRVETYNGGPAIQSPIQPRLAELGFVRDFPGMAFYSAWAPTSAGAEAAGP